MSFSCTSEYLELRDGGTENSPLINIFCDELPSTQRSTDNFMFVKYSTNVDDPKTGFRAKISVGKIKENIIPTIILVNEINM